MGVKSEAPVLAVGVLLALLALPGCTGGTSADPRNERTPDGVTMTTTPVRTDRELLTRRFPKLGAFVEAHWVGTLVGSTDIPGPSGVMLQAVVVLLPEDLAAIMTDYAWEPARPGWDANMKAELRPYVPTSGDWRHNPQFQKDVHSTSYNGDVYIDLASGTVFLDVVS